MQHLTQTQPDNCWQTCIAVLLDVSINALPDQHALDDHRDRNSYGYPLQAYLYKHHNLLYIEIEPDQFPIIDAQRVPHIMIGERSKEHSNWHAVIGIGGEVYWDVSPKRTGLTKVLKYGVLVPFPKEIRDDWLQREAVGDPITVCRCPLCKNV